MRNLREQGQLRMGSLVRTVVRAPGLRAHPQSGHRGGGEGVLPAQQGRNTRRSDPSYGHILREGSNAFRYLHSHCACPSTSILPPERLCLSTSILPMSLVQKRQIPQEGALYKCSLVEGPTSRVRQSRVNTFIPPMSLVQERQIPQEGALYECSCVEGHTSRVRQGRVSISILPMSLAEER